MTKHFIEVKGLKKYFELSGGVFFSRKKLVRAVDDVSFYINKGETLGLVGESGSGKSTVARCILRLIEPTAGEIYFDGIDLLSLNRSELQKLRGKRMGLVFQDPQASLNPRMTVMDILSRPLEIHKLVQDKNEKLERILKIIEKVGLRPEHLGRYPHEFSGGQQQRIAIARAIITNPDFVVLDEPTSALDVSVQAQILNLLNRLQRDLELTYLFISHDLTVIRHMSDRVAVMYLGKIVEIAETEELFENMAHPYTLALLSAAPFPDPKRRKKKKILLKGEIPSPINPPSGCRFHTRCPFAKDRCKKEEPQPIEIKKGHFVACHFPNLVQEQGIGISE